MNFLFRIAVFVPVLFLIAIVIVGQHHTNAPDTVRAAVQRTVRWLVWSLVLLLVMFGLELVFIGF